MTSAHRTPFVLLALFAAVLVAGCEGKPASEPAKGPAGEPAKNTPKDPLTEAKEGIAAGTAVMVDVRSQEERNAGHLDGAIFLPITKIKEKAGQEGFPEWAAGKIPKGKVIYLH